MGNRKHDIKENLTYERLAWRVKQFTVVILILIVFSALLGLLGGKGLLSTEVVSEGSKLSIEYPKYIRYKSPFLVVLTIKLPKEDESDLLLWIETSYLNNLTIDKFHPFLQFQGLKDGKTFFAFYNHEYKTADQSFVLAIEFCPQVIGHISAQMGIVGEKAVELTHFIFP